MVAKLAWTALVLAAIGCSSTPTPATTSFDAGIGADASPGSDAAPPPPPFQDNTGQAANPQPAYPAAPYGVEVGSVIRNFAFLGYRDAALQKTKLESIQLSDFYNPHGKDATYAPPAGGPDDRYFPSGSGYENAGKLKPTVLLLDVASVWCGPCNDETKNVFPAKHSLYAPCGGEFLVQLADGPTPGTLATALNLQGWTSKYAIDYPGAIDPGNQLEPLWAAEAYPENLVVDTTMMRIVASIGGEAVPGTCGTSASAGVCATDSDCAACSGGTCADGSPCSDAGTCPPLACTPYSLWTTFESHLDKSRTGCTVQ